jgi:SAM-dependent methyltransferase
MLAKVVQSLRRRGVAATARAAIARVRGPRPVRGYRAYRGRLHGARVLEIGGPSDLFRRRGLVPIYPIAASVDNCNFASFTVWEGAVVGGDTFTFDPLKPNGRQYVCEATNLASVPTGQYDAVISSHTIEHTANPIGALREWARAVRPGGWLVLIVPHKDGTFDWRRPVTRIEHLIEDFEAKRAEDDLTHLEEILSLHDLSRDPGAKDLEFFKRRAMENATNRCLHHHVFDTGLVANMVGRAGLEVLSIARASPQDIVVLAERTSRTPP